MAAWSAPEVQLLEPLILLLLIADVCADGLFVPADRVHEVPAGPEIQSHEVALALSMTRAKWLALLPLMYPTTCDTAYFGGIDSSRNARKAEITLAVETRAQRPVP